MPAGVAMPPISGPKAVEIISARPKLLCPGRSPASCRSPTPSGSSIAATAMSVIHIDISVPTVSIPSSTRSVRVPTRSRTWYVIRVPSPDCVKAADISSTPMKKVITGSPKPARTTSR